MTAYSIHRSTTLFVVAVLMREIDRLESTTHYIRDCLGGEEQGCTALFDQYKGLVYRTAHLMLGNARDAEDTLQDVFTQAFAALHRYDATRAAFSTWLHRITVNACLGRLRRSRYSEPLPLIDAHVPADLNGDPFQALSMSDQAHHLLGALDDDQRVVIVLRFYFDLSYVEIAEITQTPLGTVQSRFGRAIKKMRAAMQQSEAS